MSRIPVTISTVGTADLRDAAVSALVAAFIQDPAWSTTLPDPRRRTSVLRTALAALASDAGRRGTLMIALVDREVVAAAVALPPGYHPSPLRTPRYLRAGAAILRDARVASLGLWQRWHALRAADPTQQPHWHLAALGVRPDAQRRGVGSALLEAFLRRIDDATGATYLETSRPELVAWYTAAGFEVRERFVLPGGGQAWTMWRHASPSRRLAPNLSRCGRCRQPRKR